MYHGRKNGTKALMKGMIDRFLLFAVSAVFQSSDSGKDRRMAQPLQYLERLLDLRMWYFDCMITKRISIPVFILLWLTPGFFFQIKLKALIKIFKDLPFKQDEDDI